MDFRVAYFTNIDNFTHSLGDGKKNYIKFKIFCQKNKECEKVITSDVFCLIYRAFLFLRPRMVAL